MVISSGLTFLRFETTQSTTTVFDSTVEFPAVTFCNLMPFDFMTGANMEILQETIKDVYPDIHAVDLDIVEMLDYLRTSVQNRRVNGNVSDRLVESLGFSYDSMVISCYFNSKKCTRSDFVWSWSYQYGNCYTFNKKIK